jgi:hypothetical protein
LDIDSSVKLNRKLPSGWELFLNSQENVKNKILKPEITIDVEAANAVRY